MTKRTTPRGPGRGITQTGSIPFGTGLHVHIRGRQGCWNTNNQWLQKRHYGAAVDSRVETVPYAERGLIWIGTTNWRGGDWLRWGIHRKFLAPMRCSGLMW